jgi:hypothetical protein
MPTTLKREPQKDMEQHKRETLHTLIGEQVIHSLGEPDDLLQLQVRWLWEDYFRVNVLIGRDITSFKIANSYFVKADSDGNIVESNPNITKKY